MRDAALADPNVQKFVGAGAGAQGHRRAGQARQRRRVGCRRHDLALAVRPPCALGMPALGACGFRLAGSDPLPAVLARPYLSVKDPYTDFAREFEHQLKSAGAVLAARARKIHGHHRSDEGLGRAAHAVGVGAQHPDRVRTDLHRDVRGARAGHASCWSRKRSIVEGLQLRGERAARQGARGGHLARGRWRGISSPSPCAG